MGPDRRSAALKVFGHEVLNGVLKHFCSSLRIRGSTAAIVLDGDDLAYNGIGNTRLRGIRERIEPKLQIERAAVTIARDDA